MLRSLLMFCLSGLLLVSARAAPSHQVVTPQVRAELVAHAPEGVGVGKPLWLGLLIEHRPQWHTYWKNPGDSGLPTTLAWTLPPALQAGDIRWPTPRRLPVGPLMNFGYEGRLLLPVAVTVAAAPVAPTLRVQLDAQWLVCKEVCIPESGQFAIELPTQAATAVHGALFAAAAAAQPQPLAAARAQARLEDQTLVLEVDGLPADWRGREIELLPETAGIVLNAAPVAARWQGGRWSARVPLDPQRSEGPPTLPLVLVRASDRAGLQLQAEVGSPWPAPTAQPAAAPALGDAVVTPRADGAAPGSSIGTGSGAAAADGARVGAGFALALGLAFVGGLLLNLMPCVFPVLSLKLLGFAAQAQDRRRLLAGGVAYGAGVVLSFVALAGLLLALRAGGEQLGWGFQLQSPQFVAALALLFTLIGLNLAGAFEFGSLLPARWSGARARHPLLDALLTGVLAVAVASPCTAPFMGAALGAALAFPAAQALMVFAALGLGMAAPYLLASAWPALAGALPRPGPWMAHFKTLMAFPMFATVIWLVWVLGQQSGIDGVAALLGVLLALAFLAWALGSPALGLRARRSLGALALLLTALTLSWAWPALRAAEATAASATPDNVAGQSHAATDSTAPDALPARDALAAAPAAPPRWQAWSPERVAQLTAAGQAVFVDFTAAWCVTCQFNKRGTLADAEVLAAFGARNVALLRADWTRRDARITAALAALGRSGVPVYALYAPGAPTPRLLGEILRAAEVKDALAALPGPG